MTIDPDLTPALALDLDSDIDLDIDFDDSAARRARRYVREVVAGIGLRGDSSFVETEPHPAAYVALDGRLPDFPDHDVALLWNESSGWSAAIEDRRGELVVVARMGGDPRPSAGAVVSWVRGLFRRECAQGRSNRDFAAFVPSPRADGFS
ncbi:DUF6292 family protein [Lentzea flava]|uniref:DUF6292 family protein n=1 Tax=Lentzea flava TaxID=103732 RepID=UPI00167037D4|nr:DUF6292 family protein [Lentzea flava]